MSTTIDKNDLAQKIKSLDGLTSDEKSALIGLLNTRKKYGLVWEEKLEDVEELLREKLPVFTEVKERRIDAQPQEKEAGKLDLFSDEEKDSAPPPDHIIIEGDNLHALTALLYTHEGKVDVIDIDPPYNTGNKDFVYNDSYVDKEDAWRHSKWLCFMSKRLKLAKMLLKESGVIFIHIDDNEQAPLKLLCDEIFGEENFLNNIIWQKKYSPQNDALYFSDNHDFIIAYKKPSWKIQHLPRTKEQEDRYKNPDNDPRGVWKATDFSVKSYSKSYDYPIELPSGRIVNPPASRCWVTSKERLLELKLDNRIWFGPKGDNVPALKKFLTEVKEGTTPLTIWSYEEVGHNQSAKQELKAILHNTISTFDTPKPVKLLNRILQISTTNNNDFTILDFFAGSGTTLHATMALNAEDKGRRQCILVTNNENNICEEVTYKRNKRVIQGYTKQNGEKVAGLTNNNLRYYKTDFVDREPTMKNRKVLTRAAVDLLCIRENCYNPHQTLDTKEIRVFTSQMCELVIIFDPDHIETALPVINTLYPGKVKRGSKPRCKVYVFSPGHYAFNDEFEQVQGKIELCALPEAIYRAYKAVLPKAKQRILENLENADGHTNA